MVFVSTDFGCVVSELMDRADRDGSYLAVF